MTTGMITINSWDFYADGPLGATLGYNGAHGTDINFFKDLIAYSGTRVRLNIKPDLYVASSMSASPSTWTWAFVDQVVTMANQNNIRVTLVARGLQPSLSYPSWQEASSCAAGYDQTTIPGYVKIAVALARRYSGDGNPDNAHEVDVNTGKPITGGKTLQADCIEIGNEEINSMQDSSSLPYTGCRKAMRYVKLVRDVLTQLRAPSTSGGGGWVPRGNFQARVGAWGIVHDQPNEITSTYGILTHPVLDATYNPSANSSSIFGFDSVLGVQLLDYANFHNYNEPDGSGGLTPAAECKQIRGILDGVGNTNIPIWCTEAGRNGPCFADTVKLQDGTIENEEIAQANYYAASDDGSGGGGLQALKDSGCQHWDIFTLNYWGGGSNGKYVGQYMSVATLTTSSGSPPNSYIRFKAHGRISNFMSQQDKGAWAAQAAPKGFGTQSTGGVGGGGGGTPPPTTVGTVVATDTFIRANQSGFGTASDAVDTWVNTNETGTPTVSITSNKGKMTGSANATGVELLGTLTETDCDAFVRTSFTASGDSAAVVLRSNSGGTVYYRASLSGGNLTCHYFDGVTQNVLYTHAVTYTAGITSLYWIRFRIVGTSLQGRFWADGTTEPNDFTSTAYAFTVTDATLASGKFGVRGRVGTTSDVVLFDMFTAESIASVSPPTGNGTLTGSFSPLASATVNLTSEGQADWAHWNGTTYDHKSAAGSQISNFTTVGNGSAVANPTALNTFVWSDGTPDASGTTATGAQIIPAATGTSGAPGAAGQATKPNVMVVALENHSYSQVIGNGSMPHINSLATTYGTCTNFFAISHPSLPNYIAFASGSDQGVINDTYNPANAPLAATTLVDQLATAGIGWKHYQENLPSTGYLNGDTGSGSTLYTQHHNPWVYFKSIRNNSAQSNRIVNYSDASVGLSHDLTAGTAPPFIFVTPSNTNNGHTGTDTQCDNFVNSLVTLVQASTWYTTGNGIIILWWDESHPDTDVAGFGDKGTNAVHGGHCACIVISAQNSANVYTKQVNTYGMLHAIENLYGLTSLADAAHTINGDLTSLFTGNGGTPPPPPFTLLPGEVITGGVSNYVFGTNYSAIASMSVPTPTAGMNSSVQAAGLKLMRVFIDNTATDPQITGRVNAVIATGCTPLVTLWSATSSTFNQHVVTLLGASCLIYEFGNEPDGTINPIASGTFNSAWATQIPLLRAINPSAAFLSPGFNNGASTYLTSWLNSCVSSGVLPDGVGFHLYACGSIGTSATCLTHTSDYAAQINTLRTQVTSVLGVARPIGISEWNVDYHFPEVSYSHNEPFVENYYLGVLTSMIAANLDYACQFACFGTTAYHMIDENTGVTTAYYTAMSQAIAKLSPTFKPPTTSNLGNGFRLTFPADTNARTANIYTDVNQGIATLAASLSDGSAPDFYDSTLANKTAASAGVYALSYNAAGPNQSLNVFYTLSDGTTPGTTKSSDTFTRANQSNLGTTSDAETYQLVTEAGSPTWSILSNQAKLTGSLGDSSVALLGASTLLDCEAAMLVDLSNLADSAGLVLRAASSAASYYRATLTGSSIVLAYVNAGVSTLLNSEPATLKTNTFYWLRFRILKNSLYARYWPNDGTKEPKNWHVMTVDRTIETAGQYGFRGVIGATSDTILWDTYSVVDLTTNNDPSSVSLYAADLPTGITTAAGALSVTSSTPSGTIDVTSEGTGDWAHWGLPSATSFDHKANVTQLVSNYSNIGSGTYTQNTSALLAWSWEDGLVTPTVVASTTETDVTQAGNGFSFTLPADTNSRQVYVYVYAKKAQGKLIATLSDGSATAVTDTSLNDVGTGSVLRYAITYNAGSANQTLTIQWLMLTDNGTSGSATTYSTDSFTRVNNASSWGSASDGTSGAWVQTVQFGTMVESIASNKGSVTATASSVLVSLLGTQTQANAEALVRWSISNLGNDGAALILRATSTTTYYRLGVVSGTTLTFTRRVSGTDTVLSPTATVTVVANTQYWIRFRLNGSNLYGKFWAQGSSEPSGWTLTATDTGAGAITGAGQWGLRTKINNGDTVLYDSYSVTDFGAGGGTPGSIGLDAATVPLVIAAGGGGGTGGPPPAVNATFTVNASDAVVPNTWQGLGVQQDAYLGANYKTTEIAAAPARYYPLTEASGTVATDLGTQGLNGTLHGGVTPGQPGLIANSTDTAMLFNGTSGYIDIPTTGLPTGASPWTMRAWVKIPTFPGSNFYTIMSMGTNSGNEMTGMYYDGTTQAFWLVDWSNNGPKAANNSVTIGAIYQVVGTYDGITKSLYVNGVLIATHVETLNLTFGPAYIGNDAGNEFGDGIIGQGIFDTVAWTAAQVAADYAAGTFLGLTSIQRALVNTRINYMNPPLVRTCADSVAWWCPSGVVGTYDFYNAKMLEWYQVFENAQQQGINVIVGVNSPAPFTPRSSSWCTAFAALIDQLVNNSGYTCVKYVSGLSEPDTM